MIVVVATLKARTGNEERVESIFRAMVQKVQQEKGVLEYFLHRSQTDPTLFMFYEGYSDQAALDFHNSTSYYAQLVRDLKGLLEGEPKAEFYETIAAVTR